MVQHSRDSLVHLLIPTFNTSVRKSANTLFQMLSPLSSQVDSPKLEQVNSFNSPDPPEAPLPWLWQCHLCRTTYHLSVTRRCLEDGHYFCFAVPQSVTTSPFPLSNKQKQKSQKRPQRSCTSSFDYTGWEAWNDWRHEIVVGKKTMATTHEKSNDELKTQKDCWTDCSYPSECRHSRLAATNAAALAAQRSAMINKSSISALQKVASTHKKRRSKSLEVKNADSLNMLGGIIALDPVNKFISGTDNDWYGNATQAHGMPLIVEEAVELGTLPLVFRIECEG